MSKRKALGKGLRSLIPDAPPPRAKRAPVSEPAPAPAPAAGPREIDIDRIQPNPRQPRKEFDQVHLEELAASLQEHGLLQPVVVRPKGGGSYELIAGERRWRAAQIAGLLRVPVVVQDVADEQMLELALIENIQREELNPIETARAFQLLMDDLNLTQQEISERVGKSRSTVANSLRLLNLSREVQAMIEAGTLHAGHAKALASVSKAALQSELAQQISRAGMNVRQAETLVSRALQIGRGDAPRSGAKGELDPNIQAAESRLASTLGTKVKIVQQGKKGRIELHFFSHEEMERVYQMLMDAKKLSR